jgi:hypothetical protein
VLPRFKVSSKTGFGVVRSFYLTYTTASYSCCCSCCSCSTRVEKEEEVTPIQEHKKPGSKINPRNSKPRRSKIKKNLPLSTLNDRE